MTKLAAVLDTLMLIAVAGVLSACGRTPIGDLPGGGGAGGASNGCQTNADCPAGEQCDLTTHTCVPTPGGCTSDADCADPTPHCRLDVHTCVQCTNSSQCPSGEACSNFQCVGFCGGGESCTNGLTCCTPLCVDTGSNLEDCGACGNVCGPYANAEAICSTASCGIAACVAGFGNCDGIVANGCETATSSDPGNCGGCGNVCPPGDACSGGECVGPCGTAGCPGTQLCCGALCANTQADPSNCGNCGVVCGQVANGTSGCVSSGCAITSCIPGFADCDGQFPDGCEVNLGADPNNCGFCGNACGAGVSCVSGVCETTGNCTMTGCPGGETCCDAGTTCADTQNDLNNCGGCGVVCGPGFNACQGGACCENFDGGGVCTGMVCPTPLVNCAGTCVDESNDPNNCGFCGISCVVGASCVGGICTGGGGCNGGPVCPFPEQCCMNGCTDTTSDPNNCGGCSIFCPPGEVCSNSACTPTCNGGPACNVAQECCPSGCSSPQSDPNNCGFCGNVCPPGSNCSGGACTSTCNGGPVCPMTEQCCKIGCVDTTSDPQNCGGCNIACPANAMCSNSQCTSTSGCNGGPVCNGTQQCCPTGCASTSSDPLNCGFCGNVCPPGDNCSGGICMASCNGGPVCTGTLQCCSTGCSNITDDPKNCGGCGIPCGPGSMCVGGSCTPTCDGGPACTGGLTCCPSGCSNTTSDPKNCGACGKVCGSSQSCVNSVCVTQTTCNGGPACTGGLTCCPSGCSNTASDNNNCGGCGKACGATADCVGGSCTSTEGAFDPTVNPTYLSAGAHSYTSINIPAGVTVYVTGSGPASGTLDLSASGPILIDGTIDVSGGPGTQNVITSQSTQSGRAGGGGFTGEPYASAAESAACQWIGGNGGQLGFGVQGSPGNCSVLSTTVCVTMGDPTALIFTSPLAQYGGGAGVFTGYRAYGSGGGGAAGGAPGMLCADYPGEEAIFQAVGLTDCTGISGGGGAVNGAGGVAGNALYDGITGISGSTQCPGAMPGIPPACVGGGGGGSIGATAFNDLAVLSTFQTGSGGGGGSADYLNRPVFGGTSGGGGGGGALRLSSPTSITVNGQIFANGGPGGDAGIGNGSNANCDPQPGAAGGGGSGGVIYLSSPSVVVGGTATITAVGGSGGAQSEFATGGGGGTGGLGRIRLSVTPATCTVSGNVNPPLAAGCTPVGAKAGNAYVGVYPN